MAPHHPFVKAIGRSLRHRCGVEAGSSLLVAVSGGGDSVALLRALAAIAPRRGWKLKLSVGHVQHHLRDEGGQAEADAQFVAQLAEQLGLDGLRADLDPQSLQQGGNTEALARQGRYDALTEMAEQAGADFVATAHHGDDQLETILMRLLRGSSVRGLAGMAWRRHVQPGSNIWLIRPMLALDRADVLRFLHDLNQPWRRDHTNADVTRLRARLRHDVLPVLHDIQPNLAHRTVGAAQHLRDVAHMMNRTIEMIYHEQVRGDAETLFIMDRDMVGELIRAMVWDLMRRVLIEAGCSPDTLTRKTLSPIVSAIRDGKGGKRTFDLSNSVVVTITRSAVHVKPARKSE